MDEKSATIKQHAKRNATIKEYAKKNGIPLWMIAERYKGGITDSYFSRILRRKFSDDEEKEILSIIDAIATEQNKAVR